MFYFPNISGDCSAKRRTKRTIISLWNRLFRIAPLFPIGLAPLFVAAATPSISDWPGYLGPHRNSISADSIPLADSWPESGPPLVWTAKIHPGHSGAAIVDRKVYVMDRVDSEKDVLLVFDLGTGEELDRGEVESAGRVNFPGARTVPTVTDHHVFTAGPMGVVAAWKRDDLSQLWTVDVINKFGAKPFHVGYSTHPQAYKNLVILSTHSEEASLVALHAKTGKVAWKASGLHGSLATPIIRRFQGRDQILYISNETPENPKGNGASSVAGLDPETGKILWRYRDFAADLPIPPPIVVNDNTLFVTGAYEAGAQLLRIGLAPKPIFDVLQSFRWGSHLCAPIVYQEHLYLLSHENATLKDKRIWPEVGLTCINVNGKQRWNTGVEPMFGRGSMIIADGKLLIRDSYHGKLYMVAPSPEGYRQLAVANPFDLNRSDLKRWAPLAISHGLLIVRDEREIKCLDLRQR